MIYLKFSLADAEGDEERRSAERSLYLFTKEARGEGGSRLHTKAFVKGLMQRDPVPLTPLFASAIPAAAA